MLQIAARTQREPPGIKMVLKRPDTGSSNTDPQGKPQIELIEELVKKSLDVNPSLGGGRDVQAVMSSLKKEAIQAKSGAPPSTPTASLADRRKSTIAFFLEQKQAEFEELAADITVRENVLLKERQDLQRRIFEELLDFLALMSGGVDSPEARQVVHEHRGFVAQLGVTEVDVVLGTQKRRNDKT
jgi:hypothetical protein